MEPYHTAHMLEQSLAHGRQSGKYLSNEQINIGQQILRSRCDLTSGCALFPLWSGQTGLAGFD